MRPHADSFSDLPAPGRQRLPRSPRLRRRAAPPQEVGRADRPRGRRLRDRVDRRAAARVLGHRRGAGSTADPRRGRHRVHPDPEHRERASDRDVGPRRVHRRRRRGRRGPARTDRRHRRHRDQGRRRAPGARSATRTRGSRPTGRTPSRRPTSPTRPNRPEPRSTRRSPF